MDDGVSSGDDGSDDGGGDTDVVVEAGTLGTVTASAVLYDPRLGDSNGCDPDGCTAALTRVRKPTNSHMLHLALIRWQKSAGCRYFPSNLSVFFEVCGRSFFIII